MMTLKDTLAKIFRGRGRGKKPAATTRKANVPPIDGTSRGSLGTIGLHVACAPADGVISGLVSNSGQSVPGVTITLTGMTTAGTSVNVSTTTDIGGDYKFLQVQPGTYALSRGAADVYIGGSSSLGSLGGNASADSISTITILPGQVGGQL